MKNTFAKYLDEIKSVHLAAANIFADKEISARHKPLIDSLSGQSAALAAKAKSIPEIVQLDAAIQALAKSPLPLGSKDTAAAADIAYNASCLNDWAHEPPEVELQPNLRKLGGYRAPNTAPAAVRQSSTVATGPRKSAEQLATEEANRKANAR